MVQTPCLGVLLAFYVNKGIQPLSLLYILNCNILSLSLYISLNKSLSPSISVNQSVANTVTPRIPWVQPGLHPCSYIFIVFNDAQELLMPPL